MELLFRPIQTWPGKLTGRRRRAQFKAGYNATLALLDSELRSLQARSIVLQVALTEDDIRLDDRYGVTRRGEQYRGWTALPPPATPRRAMEPSAARLFIYEASRMPVNSEDELRAAYRAAAMKLHPDRGGDADQFARLQEAKEVLHL